MIPHKNGRKPVILAGSEKALLKPTSNGPSLISPLQSNSPTPSPKCLFPIQK